MFALVWAIVLELNAFKSAPSRDAAVKLLAARPLLRILHDASTTRLIEKSLRAFTACQVR
jgi:hypothetical protein